MPEFKVDVNDFTLIDWTINKSFIEIAKGHANDRMIRGSYKTKERFYEKRRLFYRGIIENKHRFSDDTVSLNISVDETRLSIEGPKEYNRLWFTLNASQEEHIYGCGEQFTKLDLKGESVPIWVSEHHSVRKLIKKWLRETFRSVNYDYLGAYRDHASYHAQPTFMSSLKYAVHCESSHYAQFSFNKHQTVLYFREIPKAIHIFKAADFLTLSKKLNQHIGIQKPLPTWTEKGIILAIQGGTEVIDKKLQEALKQGLNIVGVWAQDWSGQTITKFGDQVYWNWSLDEVRYRDLKQKMMEWKKQGIAFLGYINPFLKEHSPQYEKALKEDYLVTRKNKQPYLVKSTTFKAGMIDLTNPRAYVWTKDLIKKEMIDLGMAGWMADFGEYLPTDAILFSGKGETLHNHYPELWAKCNQEAIQESKSQAFIFSRAAYTKTLSETNAMWIGDQHVDFSDQYGLGSVIPAFLSMATVGVGINHSDIGGYTTIFHMRRSSELLIRWAELSLFTPLFRTHEGNLPKRNVQYDNAEVIDHFVKFSRVYDKMSQYLNSMKTRYYETGIPVIRPLFFHFDEAFAYTTKTMFMYGTEILVAPVLRPNVKAQEVEFPQGTWIHLFTKKSYVGGKHTVETPLGVPCAFYDTNSKFKLLFDTIEL